MAMIQVLRPCIIHCGADEYNLEPGIRAVPAEIADRAIGHGLAVMFLDDTTMPDPVTEPEPIPVVEDAPDKAMHLKGTRRKGTSRRRRG